MNEVEASILVAVTTLVGLALGAGIALASGLLLSGGGIRSNPTFSQRIIQALRLKLGANRPHGALQGRDAAGLSGEGAFGKRPVQQPLEDVRPQQVRHDHVFGGERFDGYAVLAGFLHPLKIYGPLLRAHLISEALQSSNIFVPLHDDLRAHGCDCPRQRAAEPGCGRNRRNNPIHLNSSRNGVMWCANRYARGRRRARRPASGRN